MKRVHLTVRMTFEVPDDTTSAELSVEFPAGDPVVHGEAGAIANGQFLGHGTEDVEEDEGE
jgi:hypothetical protein